MKIDEPPYYFGGTSPVEKLRRPNPALDAVLDELDLSFLDLLNDTIHKTGPDKSRASALSDTAQAADEATANNNSGDTNRPKLTLVEKAPPTEPEAEPPTAVDPDMILKELDLLDADIQYLKQAVIPGLPIVAGSVPFESLFPLTPDGEISYQGFEISSKLVELIEKGYKTGRPIRVELDPKSSVILKIRNGQVSAEFVSTDRSMAVVMQQELDDLRHRMALKNLPVGTLSYKHQDEQQSGKQQPQTDPENER